MAALFATTRPPPLSLVQGRDYATAARRRRVFSNTLRHAVGVYDPATVAIAFFIREPTSGHDVPVTLIELGTISFPRDPRWTPSIGPAGARLRTFPRRVESAIFVVERPSTTSGSAWAAVQRSASGRGAAASAAQGC